MWYIYVYIFLLLVTKAISTPQLINLSPADILWPVMIIFILWSFYKKRIDFKVILKNTPVLMFCILTLWRVLSSLIIVLIGQMDLFPGLIIHNVKAVISLGYVLIGLFFFKTIDSNRLLKGFIYSTFVFSAIGVSSALLGYPSWGVLSGRIVSTTNDPNIAGIISIIGLMSLWKYKYSGYSMSKWFSITYIFVATLVIILTGSRTAIIGVFLILIVYVIVNGSKWMKILLIAMSLLLGIGIILIYDSSYNDGQYYSMMVSRSFEETESAIDFRSVLRKSAIEMGSEHFVLGVGSGQFPRRSNEYFEQFGIDVKSSNQYSDLEGKVVHNTYLSLFAENGVLAIFLYTAMLIIALCNYKSKYQKLIMILIALFSYLFNIENSRFIWFTFGAIGVFAGEENYVESDQFNYAKHLPIILCLVVVLYQFLPPLWRPSIVNGQHFEVDITSSEIELIIEYKAESDGILVIDIDGQEPQRILVQNDLGLYYQKIKVDPGKIEVTLESLNDEIVFYRACMISEEEEYFIYSPLWLSSRLQVTSRSKASNAMFTLLNLQTDEVYQKVQQESQPTVSLNQQKGVNFGGQVSLISSTLSKENDLYTIEFLFEKTGEIDNELVLLCRGYDLNSTSENSYRSLSYSYTFDKSLVDLEVGEKFTGKWNFRTENRPHMLYIGLYYYEQDGNFEHLSPIYARLGYIQ